MSEFSDALKQARRNAGKKLRETSKHIGVSLSYMSDIERGHRNPPEPDVVRKLEKYLGVEDGRLVQLAQDVRQRRPTDLAQTIQQRTNLSELFFRIREYSDEDLLKLIESIELGIRSDDVGEG